MGLLRCRVGPGQDYMIDIWLEEIRAQVVTVASGKPLRLSLVMAVNPQRNQDTALQLVDEVERVADASWLPVLRAWGAVETKRVRRRLWGVIERLEDAS